MASIQASLADYMRPDLTDMGVTRVALLWVQPPNYDGRDVICSLAVNNATYKGQNLDRAPLYVTSNIAVDFVFEFNVKKQQEIKDKIYAYFTDHLHWYTGVLKPPGAGDFKPVYEVFGAALTGYGQDTYPETDLGMERYALTVQHSKIAER